MVVRRMGNRYADQLEERKAEKRYAKESVDVERARLEKQMVEKDDAMLDLQRRVLGENVVGTVLSGEDVVGTILFCREI